MRHLSRLDLLFHSKIKILEFQFFASNTEISRCHTFIDKPGFCIRLEVGEIAPIFVRGCPPGAKPGPTEMSRLGITEKEKYKRPLYIIRKLCPGHVTSTTVQTSNVLSLTLQGSPDFKKMYSRVDLDFICTRYIVERLLLELFLTQWSQP